MFMSRRGYNWNNVLPPEASGPITGWAYKQEGL